MSNADTNRPSTAPLPPGGDFVPCVRCERPNYRGHTHCHECGSRLFVLCKHCGQHTARSIPNCEHCGEKIDPQIAWMKRHRKLVMIAVQVIFIGVLVLGFIWLLRQE